MKTEKEIALHLFYNTLYCKQKVLYKSGVQNPDYAL